MSKTEFAERVGWDRGYLYRRLSGETAIDVCNLDEIERNVRFRAEYLMFGHEPKIGPPRPGGGGGAGAPPPADEGLLSGSNRRALAYLVAGGPAPLRAA